MQGNKYNRHSPALPPVLLSGSKKTRKNKREENPREEDCPDMPTFINHLAILLEKLAKWSEDPNMTKEDVINGVRTSLLQCMRAGLVHPFTTFYSVEMSTTLSNESHEAAQKKRRA